MKITKVKNYKTGFTLIEILVVVTIFAVIGILSTRSVFLTIRGAKKSDSLIRVRENANYAMAVVERQLRNAESVTCPNASTSTLNYISIEGIATSFTCSNIGTNGYIASGSARLTSSDIGITSCSFSCTQTDLNMPPIVDVLVVAQDNETLAEEKGQVEINTQITIRNY